MKEELRNKIDTSKFSREYLEWKQGMDQLHEKFEKVKEDLKKQLNESRK
jgi:uncharacterized protein YukE